MKKVLFLAAALLVASSAFAAGIDLSIGGCPGAGAATGGEQGVVDCAGGGGVTVIATLIPAENIPDLVAIDGIFDAQVAGDFTTNGFWNFDQIAGCNVAALANSHTRPAGCTSPAYTATFSLAGSGEAVSAVSRGPAIERIAFTCYRPGVLAVTAGQKLFATTLSIDGTTATEAGGTCSGCSAPFFLVWNIGYPRSNGTIVPTELGTGTGSVAGINNQLGFNGGMALCCQVPTKKHTWGQLKSLYR